jgi:hypothetical protein
VDCNGTGQQAEAKPAKPTQRIYQRGASNALVRDEFRSLATEVGLVQQDAIDEPEPPNAALIIPHAPGTEFLEFRFSPSVHAARGYRRSLGAGTARFYSMQRHHFEFRCHLLVNQTTNRTDGYGIGSVDDRNRPIAIGVLVKSFL